MFSFLFGLVYSSAAFAVVTSGLTAELKQQAERSAAILQTSSSNDEKYATKSESERALKIASALGGGAVAAGYTVQFSGQSHDELDKIYRSDGFKKDFRTGLRVALHRIGTFGAFSYTSQQTSASATKDAANSLGLIQTPVSKDALLNQGGINKLAQSTTQQVGDLFLLSAAERAALQHDLEAGLRQRAKAADPSDFDLGAVVTKAKANGRDLFTGAEKGRVQELFSQAKAEAPAPEPSQKETANYLLLATARMQLRLEEEGKGWTPVQKRRAQQLIDGNMAALRKVALLDRAKHAPSAAGEEAEAANSDAR